MSNLKLSKPKMIDTNVSRNLMLGERLAYLSIFREVRVNNKREIINLNF
jgi:hypothetical protein